MRSLPREDMSPAPRAAHARDVRRADPARPALSGMSDAWLMGRARELRAAVQSVDTTEQHAIIAELDVLLAEAETRGEPRPVADLLRSAAIARLATPGARGASEELLNRLLAHASSHRLPIVRADAHALRGRRLILGGKEDAALTEIARALAIVDDHRSTQIDGDRRSAENALTATLTDCCQSLIDLGLYETAEEVATKAYRAIEVSASPHDITVQLFNLILMMLSWAIRLERVGRQDQARQKLMVAASVATEVDAPFTESLFRHGESAAIEQVGVVAAAVALADPDGAHISRLHRLFSTPTDGQEKCFIAIALARCLAREGRRPEARSVLLAARDEVVAAEAPGSARLNLEWELARMEAAADPTLPDSMRTYTAALEAELWEMRESLAAALRTRREHEVLTAEHEHIEKQAKEEAKRALHDLLTGLPNRRSLDKRIRELAADAAAHPLAVALVDLDGFKGVNDTQSHAEGDDVLRVIASTLRDTLRSDDFVARYGGDEFVALLPGAPAQPAAAAMNRAVKAVAALPGHLSRGVTLSIGLVSMESAEHPEAVLARADTAMYRAKRAGGNRVEVGSPPSGG